MAIRPISVKTYNRMINTDVLGKYDRVEMLEGWIVTKKPHPPEICCSSNLIQAALRNLVGPPYMVDINPQINTPDSCPEPMLAIIHGNPCAELDRHPNPDEVETAIEIADMTLAADRHLRKRVYARGGIRRYWIVNLKEKQVEVYTRPTMSAKSPDYRERQDYGVRQSVPVMLGGELMGKIPIRTIVPPFMLR